MKRNHPNDSSNSKRKYDVSRHHAWAGTVLLSVLLAIRVFIETMEIENVPDGIILAIGVILVIYILISLFFTYRYRSGLMSSDTKVTEREIIHHYEKSNGSMDEKTRKKIDKNEYKREKKRTKAESKKSKNTKR
jgi:hypothetical protein